MERIWIVESRYYDFDQDDGRDIEIRNDTYVHKTKEGAIARFEGLKEALELWGMDEEDCEAYEVTGNHIVIATQYQANELIIYQNDLYD